MSRERRKITIPLAAVVAGAVFFSQDREANTVVDPEVFAKAKTAEAAQLYHDSEILVEIDDLDTGFSCSTKGPPEGSSKKFPYKDKFAVLFGVPREIDQQFMDEGVSPCEDNDAVRVFHVFPEKPGGDNK